MGQLFESCSTNVVTAQSNHTNSLIQGHDLTVGKTYYFRIFSKDLYKTTSGNRSISITQSSPNNYDECNEAASLMYNEKKSLPFKACTPSFPLRLPNWDYAFYNDIWTSFVADSSCSKIHLDLSMGATIYVSLFESCDSLSPKTTLIRDNIENELTFCELQKGKKYLLSIGKEHIPIDTSSVSVTVENITLKNGRCQNAIDITQSYVEGNFDDAEYEEDPTMPNLVNKTDLWYKIIPTSKSIVSSVYSKGNENLVLELYDGCGIDANKILMSDSKYENNSPYSEYIGKNNFVLGKEYFLRVSPYLDVSRLINKSFVITSTNFMDCLSAQPVALDNQWFKVNKYEALNNHFWFEFTATHTNVEISYKNIAEIFMPNPVFIFIYEGCDTTNIVDCVSPYFQTTYSINRNLFKIGHTYKVKIFTLYGGSILDDLELKFRTWDSDVKANDECYLAKLLEESPTIDSLLNATPSGVNCLGTVENDIWYAFKCDSSNTVNLSIRSLDMGTYNLAVELFKGCDTTFHIDCIDINETTIKNLQLSNLDPKHVYFMRLFNQLGSAYQGKFEIRRTTLTDIDKTTYQSEISSIYPVPAFETLFINKDAKIDHVKILNQDSKEIDIIINYNGSMVESIDISHLVEGIYFIQLESNGNSSIKKLLKVNK
jgi:hypothetical protein